MAVPAVVHSHPAILPAVQEGGALERLVGKSKEGRDWGEVVRRVAHGRGRRCNASGSRVRAEAGSKCAMQLGRWDRRAVWDWGIAAWAKEGRVMLGVPHSGPGSKHLWCKMMERVGEAPPEWRKAGSKRRELRRQVWRLTDTMVKVDMVVVS